MPKRKKNTTLKEQLKSARRTARTSQEKNKSFKEGVEWALRTVKDLK